jgi:flagellar motility protein MotE (MotC chaperone)
MDEAAAAQIFEQLGATQLDMTAETLQAMNKDNSAKILGSMTPQFAAQVTQKLNALYKGN